MFSEKRLRHNARQNQKKDTRKKRMKELMSVKRRVEALNITDSDLQQQKNTLLKSIDFRVNAIKRGDNVGLGQFNRDRAANLFINSRDKRSK